MFALFVCRDTVENASIHHSFFMEKSLKFNGTLFYYHALTWLGYGTVLYLINLLTDPTIRFLSALALNLPFALIFYFALWMFRLFYSQKKYVALFCSLLVFDLLIFWAGHVYVYGFLPKMDIFVYDREVDFSQRMYLQNALLAVIRFTCYAFAYYLFGKERQSSRKMMEAKEEVYQQQISLLKTENKLLSVERNLLKQQLHPHTLHNMIHTLYARAFLENTALASDLLKLDDFIAQYLNPLFESTDLVVIEKEVRSIRNFMDLSLGDLEKGSVQFEVEGRMGNQLVPSMSIVSLVENAFKYGVLGEPDDPIVVSLKLSANRLEFRIHNKIRLSTSQVASTGIGLSNLRRRLEIHFSNSFSFSAKERNDYFNVNLVILY